MLLCETFVNGDKAHLFKLTNYNFIYKNRKIKAKGGVAIYILNIFSIIFEKTLVFS